MPSFLSPVFGAGAQLFDNQGRVLSGGKIYTYQAGTTTPLVTFTDATDTIPNANPVILDSAGRYSGEIRLEEGSSYKLVLKDANDNTLGTWDNITGVNDVTLTSPVSEWTATNLTPTYISTTSFSVPGNNTSIFQVNRRVQITVTAGVVYGYVVSSAYTSLTTVVIKPDSTALDSGISSVNVGLLSVTNPSAPQQLLAMNAAVSVASAATTNIGAALSANVTVTGTTTITAFDNVLAGIIRFVKFSGSLTLTHNGTSLILPGGINITTAAGDQAVFRSLGSGNWECITYTPVTFNLYPIVGDQFSVTCTQATGALTCGLDPAAIRFRNATLTSGQPSTVTVIPAASLVIPSGATLGVASGSAGRIVLVAIDNAGVAELAVINVAGGVDLTGTTLISTTAISAAATANNVFYSTTARSNVTFRVVGFFDAINTAGAWSNPTLVQGADPNSTAFTALSQGVLIAFTTITSTNPAWAPAAGTRKMRVVCVGGGGNGGAGGTGSPSAGGAGGNSGCIVGGWLNTVTTSYAVVIGAAGGKTSFGTQFAANGGSAGASASGNTPGTTTAQTLDVANSAAASVGGTALSGASSFDTSCIHYGGNGVAGVGGSYNGGGGAGGGEGGNGGGGNLGGAGVAGSAAPANSGGGGGGGGGGSTSGGAGGAGGTGVVYVWEYT